MPACDKGWVERLVKIALLPEVGTLRKEGCTSHMMSKEVWDSWWEKGRGLQVGQVLFL